MSAGDAPFSVCDQHGSGTGEGSGGGRGELAARGATANHGGKGVQITAGDRARNRADLSRKRMPKLRECADCRGMMQRRPWENRMFS